MKTPGPTLGRLVARLFLFPCFLAAYTMAVVTEAGAQSTYEPYTFTTLAGLAPGNVDGTGSAARFNFPSGVATDNSGNVYVADVLADTIRKITSSGVVTTLAGLTGIPGSNDGTGSAARFFSPNGVAVDGGGNLYVTDTRNNTIRKISPAGVVTTLAGLAGNVGSADGTGSAARFNGPVGIAVDNVSNIYVGDTYNDTIRKITPGGVVTTLAGSAGIRGSNDGPGSAARFFEPFGLAVNDAGNIYVADLSNCTIREITPGGMVTTLAGMAGVVGSDDGTGNAARFNYPDAVAVDGAGNVYVGDTNNNTIRKITSAGVVTTLAGLAGVAGSEDGTGSAARFNIPYGIAVDNADNVFVADRRNRTIRQVTSTGAVTTLAGLAGSEGSADGPASDARFYLPADVAVDSNGNVFVADTANHTIRRISSTGTVSTLAGVAGSSGSTDGTGSAARFSGPRGVATDTVGNVYVADSDNETIRKVTPEGEVTTLAGLAGSDGSADGIGSAARFSDPIGVAADGEGNIYVGDAGNATIRKITPAGVVTTLAGSAGNVGGADGAGSAAQFAFPAGIALDNAGNVYVADENSATIRKVTPEGVVTTLAGSAGLTGSDDGTGNAARFNAAFALAADGAANVYVTDGLNNTVRKITAAGVVTTLAGLTGITGSADGTGSAARFNFPIGVAVDSAGNVYVADSDNNTIRIGTPPSAPLLNISTRLAVQTGDNVLIGGFIIGGTGTKQVLIRGIGPSLANAGLQGVLTDPTLELHRGATALTTNDNWKVDDATGQSQEAAIEATTIPPTDDDESAILTTLQPGAYTAILAGKGGTTGVGLIEVYDLTAPGNSRLVNISTRGYTSTGDNVIIGGFIIGGGSTDTVHVLIRALGPSLTNAGVANALADPTLELHDGNGAVIDSNDNWRSDDEAQIEATGIPPTDDAESAIVRTLTPGDYTAIVRGNDNTTGVGLVEVYHLP